MDAALEARYNAVVKVIMEEQGQLEKLAQHIIDDGGDTSALMLTLQHSGDYQQKFALLNKAFHTSPFFLATAETFLNIRPAAAAQQGRQEVERQRREDQQRQEIEHQSQVIERQSQVIEHQRLEIERQSQVIEHQRLEIERQRREDQQRQEAERKQHEKQHQQPQRAAAPPTSCGERRTAIMHKMTIGVSNDVAYLNNFAQSIVDTAGPEACAMAGLTPENDHEKKLGRLQAALLRSRDLIDRAEAWLETHALPPKKGSSSQ